jgi:hypothetical protein
VASSRTAAKKNVPIESIQRVTGATLKCGRPGYVVVGDDDPPLLEIVR